ncbi:hypothetical protein G647_09743 [Cladophialophora carrionii CBS 160.54]|uniref:Gfd2/YDR514C-like C-terminal domain-containing protein n=1 Tax=Cladophialophora carrionii CBS 160.54 TaxID=1279043 RepID=V9DK47_9EURO|nr:uncharacterized protein G647_09743 [Cladophialophora carrionii CBS 160.54]ETI27061.1 hypothetical protein G647_09743 [Cladophialophora carrionii CBS 160.54]
MFLGELVQNRSTSLVAVDVKAYELNRSLVLEIGLSSITRTTNAIPHEITSRHYILKETIDLYNGTYIAGNKYGFTFGDSHTVSEKDIVGEVKKFVEEVVPAGNKVAIVSHSVDGDEKWLSGLRITFADAKRCDLALMEIALTSS